MEQRECRYCKITKDVTDFYDRKGKDGRRRRMYKCKSCEREKIQEWRKKNPEKNKAIYTKSRYKSVYGLDIEEVKKFGKCPICELEKRLVVDHCHKTGLVRDFICYSCNSVLGHIENRDKLKSFFLYIKKHRVLHETD